MNKIKKETELIPIKYFEKFLSEKQIWNLFYILGGVWFGVIFFQYAQGLLISVLGLQIVCLGYFMAKKEQRRRLNEENLFD